MFAPEKISLKVGIIAGNGDLPDQLAASLASQGYEPVIVRLGVDFSVGEAGKIMSFFREKGASTLVMVGGLSRPDWLSLKVDLKGLLIVLKVMLRSLGDDALLKVVREELEKDGFEIRGVQHFMPELLCPECVLGKIYPNQIQSASVQVGYKAAKEHGLADLGQSVVVVNGSVVAREDRSGTNSMIRSVKNIAGEKILVKVSKPQQDRDFDLPTVGLATVEEASKAGFHGIAVEALSTLVPFRDEVARKCDDLGIFFVGVSEDDL